MFVLGLSGSHRTGKTTMATEAEKRIFYSYNSGKVVALQMNTARHIQDIGFDPKKQDYSFDERMRIQEYLLTSYRHVLTKYRVNKAHHNDFIITDRTPLDLLGYTIQTIDDGLTPEQTDRFMLYAHDCYMTLNKYYNALLLVQPNIDPVESPKSAIANRAYMMKINVILKGLLQSRKLDIEYGAAILPQTRKSIDERIDYIEQIIAKYKSGNYDLFKKW